MADVVEKKMTRFQTDFFDYDKPKIEASEASQFPYLWIVSELHTYMPCLGGFEQDYFNNIRTRYAYADGDDGFSSYLHHSLLKDTDLIFIITEDNIWQATPAQAKGAIKDYTVPVYEKWKALYGEIVPKRVTVKFDLIGLSKLRELIEDCHKHHDDSLMAIFRRFHNMRRVADDHEVLIRYHSHSNEFACIEHYDGEDHMIRHIIFHGWPETGYLTNGSIQIEPKYGWASHT